MLKLGHQHLKFVTNIDPVTSLFNTITYISDSYLDNLPHFD